MILGCCSHQLILLSRKEELKIPHCMPERGLSEQPLLLVGARAELPTLLVLRACLLSGAVAAVGTCVALLTYRAWI